MNRSEQRTVQCELLVIQQMKENYYQMLFFTF